VGRRMILQGGGESEDAGFESPLIGPEVMVLETSETGAAIFILLRMNLGCNREEG
jgi:hypothetical protein